MPNNMSDMAINNENQKLIAQANTPTTKDAATAAAVVSTNTPNEITSSTTISSMADLKRKSPKFYKFMMLSLAQNICIQIKHDQDRLSDMWKQIRKDSGG